MDRAAQGRTDPPQAEGPAAHAPAGVVTKAVDDLRLDARAPDDVRRGLLASRSVFEGKSHHEISSTLLTGELVDAETWMAAGGVSKSRGARLSMMIPLIDSTKFSMHLPAGAFSPMQFTEEDLDELFKAAITFLAIRLKELQLSGGSGIIPLFAQKSKALWVEEYELGQPPLTRHRVWELGARLSIFLSIMKESVIPSPNPTPAQVNFAQHPLAPRIREMLYGLGARDLDKSYLDLLRKYSKAPGKADGHIDSNGVQYLPPTVNMTIYQHGLTESVEFREQGRDFYEASRMSESTIRSAISKEQAKTLLPLR